MLEVSPEVAGERIDRALARLSQDSEQPLSRGESRRWIDAGRVYLNGRRVKLAGRIVFAGDSLTTAEAEAAAAPVAAGGMDWGEAVLFEDEDLIVVNKPSGIPSQPTRDNAVESVSRFLSAREGRQLSVKLAHRLDRDTSGVLVMAKTDRAISQMGEAFAARATKKTYVAIARDRLNTAEATWTVDDHLAAQRLEGGMTIMRSVHRGGDRATTAFTTLSRGDGYVWIEAQPHTGRMHQIRAHLAGSKLPILGDLLYGGPRTAGGHSAARVMLHARRLVFPHPITRAELTIEAPVPADMMLFALGSEAL
jgi:RluA family pseudouridine synthase